MLFPFLKRSPCAFGFCVWLVCAGCLGSKDSFGEGKRAFVFFGLQKKEIQGILMIYPLIAAGASPFSLGKK
jgi:hypothetical protein